MSEVLVLVDRVDGEAKKSPFELLTAARELGSPSAWSTRTRTSDMGQHTSQMNFLEARNSVSAPAPDPSSSLTI